MRDRIPSPGKAGRIKLIFEDDPTQRYAIAEMADDPSEPGTQLKKANLLSDTTTTLLGIPSSKDPTPDDALQALHNEANTAAATARAIAFDGNVNDQSIRSALGEFTPYKDTYGVGYALYMHGIRSAGSLSDNFRQRLRDYFKEWKDRRQIVSTASGVAAINNLPIIKGLWRKYAFTIKGKTEENMTSYSYSNIVKNPVNGYLYGWTIPGGNSYGVLRVSKDDGKTWEPVKQGAAEFTGTSRYIKLAFSSDYKYTYLINTGYSNNKDGVSYSTDGINFSESEFRLEAWKCADAQVYDNIFMRKAGDDHYYYAVFGDNEAALARVHIYACNGKSTGTMVGGVNDDWNGGYQTFVLSASIKDGAVFVTRHSPRSDYTGGIENVNVILVRYQNGTDKKTVNETNRQELDSDYADGINGCELQIDEQGDIFLRAYVSTRNNGEAENFYKVTQAGAVGELGSAAAFPAKQSGHFGLVYKLPQGTQYEPYISSYTGQLVKDNWGAVAETDRVKVMPTFLTDQREYIVAGKTTTIYSRDERTKTVTKFSDLEAE